jgi:ABC-type amino acid transport system permease subunit
MNKKLKKTDIAQVAIRFIKQTANANTLDLNHILPSKNSLLNASIALIIAYIISKVLFLFLVLIIEAIMNPSPKRTEKNINKNEKDRIYA